MKRQEQQLKYQPLKIFHFNPTCEIATANQSPYYQAPALLREFEEELAPLMLFFAGPDDHVLKERPVSNEFAGQLSQCGIAVPAIIKKQNSLELAGQRQVELHPWGWSPAATNYLSAYQQSTTLTDKAAAIVSKSLFERKHAAGLTYQLVSEAFAPLLFPAKEQLPVILKSLEEIEKYLKNRGQMVLKLPLSSSGRGLLLIRKRQLNESNKQWIATALKQQNYLVTEPLFDKKQDLSFQFRINLTGEIEYLGTSFFDTNSNGQYQGQYLNPPPGYKEKYFSEKLLNDVAGLLLQQLEKSIFQKHYHGFLSIDALIYEEGGRIKIHPCLEINPRHNMGILSKLIEEKIHPQSSGMFRIFYHPAGTFKNFAGEQMKKNPPQLAGGKLIRGFLPLTDPHGTGKFGAYLILGNV